MLELVTIIAAGSIAATFFSDILSRVLKSLVHLRRHDADEVEDAQPAH